MPANEDLLDDVAGAVLDGETVDWQTAESTATADARAILRDLRLVSSIAQLHRQIVPLPPEGRPNEQPDRWGHLRLLERIGHGAFGEVFRAWDMRLDREVALKLLPAGPSVEGDTADAIIREGRLLARVRHPNVVTIHGAEQIADRIGLWMEFVRGETLEQLLRRGTVFTDADVIHMGLELSHAVAAVHAAGLLHRDIKAHNVTRAEDGRVVLMDFGAGQELDDSSSADLAGTPLYLAPEVLAGAPATVRSDIYSLGVLLYHLATGTYPVWRHAVDDMRRAHERNERVSLRAVRPDRSSALARVIERACDPRPDRRYPDVEALARDLAALERRPRAARVRYGLAITAAVLLVVVAGWEYRARTSAQPRGAPGSAIGPTAGPDGPVESPVIVVLPFRNSSREPDRNRLVDSLTAGLIQQLGLIQGLKVVYQQSSFALRDKPTDLAGLGRQLGVNLVVEGDAHLSSGTLVTRVALRPVGGGSPLWSDTLTREVRSSGDLTGVLNEIARTIVNKLRLTLGPTQRQYSTDIVTYETYLRARELRDKRLGKARDAIPLFEDVIRRDPSFAPAQAALAATYGDLTMSWPNPEGYALAPAEAIARMGPLTETALELDPLIAEAHVAKAYLHALARRWVDAEASFRHAIELDPTLTAVYGDFVLSTLEPWGRLDESLTLLQAALEADPLSLDLRNVLSRIQLSADRFDDALANCQRVMAEDPDFPFAAEYCARALAAKGRTDEALALFNRRRSLNEHGIAYIYAITGRRAEAEALAAQNAHLPNRVALIWAALGDRDRAFEALERLAVLNPRRAGAYLNYPELSALRGDPRG